MEQQHLDYVLVPCGFLLLAAYHAWLLLRVVVQPLKTVIGVNALNRHLWVESMMKDQVKNGVLAVQTMRNNLMASTLMASTAIMLSSLIAVLMSSGSNSSKALLGGNKGEVVHSIKFFSIVLCFMLAFLANVQSIRYYTHASVLINVPVRLPGGSSSSPSSARRNDGHVTVEYVARSVNRGSYFWSLGLRAFYFSFPLFMWVFGPVPMFATCVVQVFLLYFLDVSYDQVAEEGKGKGGSGEQTSARVDQSV